MNGAEGASGNDVTAGATFAVESLAKTKIPCLQVQVIREDDSINGVHDPVMGARNFQQLIANQDVLGVIGPLNSSVARAAIPVAGSAGLPTVSPLVTDPCLTRSVSSCNGASYQAAGTFFRISTPNDVAAAAVATYAINTLGVHKIGIIFNRDPYAQQLMPSFSATFAAKGGTITTTAAVAAGTTDFSGPVAELRASGAEAIYFAGLDAGPACRIKTAMSNAGFPPTAPLLGWDGLETQACLNVGGGAGIYIDGGTDYSSAESDRVYAALKAQFPQVTDRNTALAGYDAATVLLTAIAAAQNVDPQVLPSRDTVRSQLRSLQFSLLLGRVRFAASGDLSDIPVAILSGRGGSWTRVGSVTFTPPTS